MLFKPWMNIWNLFFFTDETMKAIGLFFIFMYGQGFDGWFNCFISVARQWVLTAVEYSWPRDSGMSWTLSDTTTSWKSCKGCQRLNTRLKPVQGGETNNSYFPASSFLNYRHLVFNKIVLMEIQYQRSLKL